MKFKNARDEMIERKFEKLMKLINRGAKNDHVWKLQAETNSASNIAELTV